MILGSQYVPGRIPPTPQALPTIFWANVNPEQFNLSCGIASIKALDFGSFKATLAFSVSSLPIIKGILPPALSSSRIVIGVMLNSVKSLSFKKILFLLKLISIMSPIFILETSHSIGSAPESSAVLKKIGAILLPKTIPPEFLFGIKGIFFPKYH